MPEVGDIAQGINIRRTGSHAREFYVWVICPICHQGRWRIKAEINKD